MVTNGPCWHMCGLRGLVRLFSITGMEGHRSSHLRSQRDPMKGVQVPYATWFIFNTSILKMAITSFLPPFSKGSLLRRNNWRNHLFAKAFPSCSQGSSNGKCCYSHTDSLQFTQGLPRWKWNQQWLARIVHPPNEYQMGCSPFPRASPT